MSNDEKNQFTKKMENLGDNELLSVIEKKDQYQAKAIEAAIIEAQNRKLLSDDEAISLATKSKSAWYYENKGKQHGPLNTFEMGLLLKDDTISNNTLVWKQSFPEWKQLCDTELCEFIDISKPPPLTGDKVNNSAAWAIAFLPLFGGIIDILAFGFFGIYGYLLSWFLINATLVTWDNYLLKKAGYKSKDLVYGIFLIPVYLWRRSVKTEQTKVFFWIWIITFLVYLSV